MTEEDSSLGVGACMELLYVEYKPTKKLKKE